MLTGVTIRRARTSDVDAVVALRDEAAGWLVSRGIRQWRPGEVGPAEVQDWLATGRLYVAEAADRPGLVGAVRVAWEDRPVWGEQPPDAGYLQALVTSRATAGQGLGRWLVGQAESVIARSGRPLARLSHLRGSTGLAAFYAGCGYIPVGTRDFPDHPGWDPVTLLERRLG